MRRVRRQGAVLADFDRHSAVVHGGQKLKRQRGGYGIPASRSPDDEDQGKSGSRHLGAPRKERRRRQPRTLRGWRDRERARRQPDAFQQARPRQASLAGKIRGPDFTPPIFQIELVNTPSLLDTKGRQVPAPVMSRAEAFDASSAAEEDRRLLRALAADPGATQRKLADAADLKSVSAVNRRLKALEHGGLVEQDSWWKMERHRDRKGPRLRRLMVCSTRLEHVPGGTKLEQNAKTRGKQGCSNGTRFWNKGSILMFHVVPIL